MRMKTDSASARYESLLDQEFAYRGNVRFSLRKHPVVQIAGYLEPLTDVNKGIDTLEDLFSQITPRVTWHPLGFVAQQKNMKLQLMD